MQVNDTFAGGLTHRPCSDGRGGSTEPNELQELVSLRDAAWFCTIRRGRPVARTATGPSAFSPSAAHCMLG